MKDQHSYLVDVGFAAAGVFVEDGVVTEAAPVFRWMIGRPWKQVQKWNKIVSIK